MSDETMLLTIAIPSATGIPSIASMMLRYKKGQQTAVEANLRPLQFRGTLHTEDILSEVQGGLGDGVELTPIHTVGCFYLECKPPLLK